MKKGAKPQASFLSSILPYLLVGICFSYILSEFYLGRNFAISILAASSTFILILLAITKKQIIYPIPQTLIFVIYISWVVLTSIFSVNVTESFWELIRLTSVLLLFLASYNICIAKDGLNKFVNFFAVGGGILITLDLILFSLSGAFKNGVFFSGFLSWHNQMAAFLLALMPLLIMSLVNFKKLYLRLLCVFLIGTSSVALILTYSRGGWIIFFIQMVLLFFLLKSGVRKYFLAFIFFFAVLLSIFITSTSSLENRLLSIPLEYTSLEYLNESPRLYTWQTGLKMASNFPLLGSGPGTFGEVFESFQSLPWLYSRNAHNHFIEALVETGIIGLVILIALIASMIKSIIKEIPSKNFYFLAISLSTFGLLAHSLVDYDFSTVSLYSVFWIFSGAALSQTKNLSREFYLKGKNIILYPLLFLFLIFTAILSISEDAYLFAKYSMDTGGSKIVQESITRSLIFNPYNGKSYILASEFYYGKKDSTQSAQMAEKAISRLPYETSHLTILGAIESDKENFKKSEGYYREAIKSRPFSDPNAYTGLSYALEKQGKIAEAEYILSEAIEKKFPLNSTYKGFEKAYYLSGLTNDLANLYIQLAKLKIMNGKPQEADMLFKIVKDRLSTPKI